jgi:hypothetical protein
MEGIVEKWRNFRLHSPLPSGRASVFLERSRLGR